MPRKFAKRKLHTCRRRAEAKKILEHVPSYELSGRSLVSVSAARIFVSTNKIQPPAILHVHRNEFTIDSFFWEKRGMYGLDYVEMNWPMFSVLKSIVDRIGSDELFGDPQEFDLASEIETIKPQYYYI